MLEDLLIEADAKDPAPIIALLEASYQVLAQEAKAAGREREAAYYRENLGIIAAARSLHGGTRPRGLEMKAPQAASSPAPIDRSPTQKPAERPRTRAPETRAPEMLAAETLAPSAKQDPPARSVAAPAVAAPAVAAPEPAAPAPLSEPPVVAKPEPDQERAPANALEPAAKPPASVDRPVAGPTVLEADQLFTAKDYGAAGECYAALASENMLPADRANHWAYCRIVGVAKRINARPKTANEWDEIEAEIQNIQRLAPKLWYGEYLRNKLAEVRKIRSRSQPQSDNLVVRGSAPDDSQGRERRFPRLFGKSQGAAPSNSKVDAEDTPRVAAAPASTGEGPGRANLGLAWQVRETANFRILYTDPQLGELAARAAEKVRAEQAKKWGSPELQKPWSPRCEIQLHPTGKAFALATGQAETTPGFSTIESNGNRITTRRILLRGDHPQLLEAILPHELTHVVVADLFTSQQIPRWADEGMAVLSEPSAEQNLRAAELNESLSAGQVFGLRQLMSIETPAEKDWSLYYAQSVSLTRFLVAQGTPEQLISFVRESGKNGVEPALREVYRINGYAELQERWQAYANERLASTK